MLSKVPWKSLACPRSECRLEITLKCGQSFRWTQVSGPAWIGALRDRVWLMKQDDDDAIEYKCWPDMDVKASELLLRDYFQLHVQLSPMYKEWSIHDPVFEKIAERYSGVRMLRQDPVENLFAFICSSNNNISRISGMVEKLALHYGDKIGEFPVEDEEEKKPFHAFPTIEALAKDPVKLEAKLRTLGFGYRAGYIAKSARALHTKGGEPYLAGLRDLPYPAARAELLTLTGVGPKVADCILLMSMDQPGAIPVDTHMFQIAAKKYLPHLRGAKSVTDRIYGEIGDHFRKLYGEYAGWAHSVLFSADLRHLQDVESTSAVKSKTVAAEKKKAEKKPLPKETETKCGGGATKVKRRKK